MLEAIEEDPHRWPYGPAWAERLRGWAQPARAADRAHRDRRSSAPSALLGIDPDRCVQVPNGFNPDHFGPRHLDHARALAPDAGRRAARLGAGRERRSATRGRSTRSRRHDETPVLLYVGRFTEVKRIPLLIEAYERARPGFNAPRAARDRRRLPRRVGGRAPLRHDPPRRRPGRLPRRLARPPRAGRHPRRHRRDRPAVGARAVRPGARRGRWPAACRAIAVDALRPGRHRRPRRDRLAGRARRRRRRSPTRSWRPSTARRAPPPRAPTRSTWRTSATPGRRSPSGSPRSTTRPLDATSLRENAALSG